MGNVTKIAAEDLPDRHEPHRPAPSRGLPRRRQGGGLALAVVGLPLLTLLLASARSDLSLESVVLLYLLVVVLIALVGGVFVSLAGAVVATLLINYFFTDPLHTLEIASRDQAVALFVFLLVAAVVSVSVEVAFRRARTVSKVRRQADLLSSLAGADLDEPEALAALLHRARETFGMESVALLAHQPRGDTWRTVDEARVAGSEPAPLRFDVPAGAGLRLVGRGPELFAEDRRLLRAFAAAADTAYEARDLTEQAREARTLADVDRQRTALLAAVGHDLRTPLAGIKAAVTSLRAPEVPWSDEDRDGLLETIESSADKLDSVVANLLDASRLQVGRLSVNTRAVPLDGAVGAALLALPGSDDRIEVDVPEDLERVEADPGLLERVLVNLLDNALRHSGDDSRVRVTAREGGESAKLEIADSGSGLSAEERERIFAPFQQAGDREAQDGVGLGLFVAKGFAEAMGGALAADESEGGGLTMRLRLPLARRAPGSGT